MSWFVNNEYHMGCLDIDDLHSSTYLMNGISQPSCKRSVNTEPVRALLDRYTSAGISTHSGNRLCKGAQVLTANCVDAMIDQDGGYTPVIAHAILTYNKWRENIGTRGRHRHYSLT